MSTEGCVCVSELHFRHMEVINQLSSIPNVASVEANEGQVRRAKEHSRYPSKITIVVAIVLTEVPFMNDQGIGMLSSLVLYLLWWSLGHAAPEREPCCDAERQRGQRRQEAQATATDSGEPQWRELDSYSKSTPSSDD